MYSDVCVWWFDVRWTQWCWSLNFSDWLALFVLHRSLCFTIFPRQFLRRVVYLFDISFCCSYFRCVASFFTYFCFSSLMLLFTWLFASVTSVCLDSVCSYSSVVNRSLLVPPFLNLVYGIDGVPFLIMIGPITLWHVDVNASLVAFWLSYIGISPSFGRYCNASNLLSSVMSNSLSVSFSRRNVVLNLCNALSQAASLLQLFVAVHLVFNGFRWFWALHSFISPLPLLFDWSSRPSTLLRHSMYL